ncbi:MAG: hypothetical protein KKC55_15760, partial [Gammaproteobacteria bacterium]|nr:hypothetical protein [Gammaproteobacteria bacterium]
MVDKTTITVGILILLLASTGILYITLTAEGLKIRIDADQATFYALNENNRYVVVGRELTSVWEGTTKLNRKLDLIELKHEFYNKSSGKWELLGLDFKILPATNIKSTRTTYYKSNISIRESWVFDASNPGANYFPVRHYIECFNCQGRILQYEVRDLIYDGPTIKNVESPQSFGMDMKVEWEADRSYWNTLYKSDILKVRFKPQSNYEIYKVRLFDPVGTITLTLEGSESNINAELGSVINVSASIEYQWYSQVAANETACTGVWDATNNCSKTYDLDWDTLGYSNLGNVSTVYKNYTTRSGADPSSMLEIRYGYSGGGAGVYENLTIPADCWNTTRLQFAFGSSFTNYLVVACFNGTAWPWLSKADTGIGNLYETRMWWNASGTVCVDVPDSPAYGINYSCGSDSTSFDFNLSSFVLTEFNDSTDSKTLNSGVVWSTDETLNDTDWDSTYSYTNVIDHDWYTFGRSNAGTFATYYVNFTGPAWATVNNTIMRWKIMTGDGKTVYVYNTTMALSGILCWNA